MDGDIVIKVDHVSKDFILPHEKVTTVKGLFTSIYKKRKKTKERQHALRDVSFEIKKGEFFGIVGRNGSGKSTMLKMLAGIYQPTKGKIKTHGKLVPFIELGVGFNPELTGRENVYLNGAMMGFSEKKVDAMYDEIVSFAELEEFMDQKLKNYSSGMQVRLAFSVAVKSEAEILLVDEVLAVGDAAFQRKCFDYFHELKAKKTTVVFITHDMNAVRQYCDRALLIEAGRVTEQGSAYDVSTSYSKLFIDEEISDESKGSASVETRWGDKALTYQKIEVSKHLREDEPLKIKVWAVAHKKIDGVVLGFMVKNAAKTALLGTNTIELRIPPENVEPHSTLYAEWEVPNIFSNGKHFVDVAIVYKNGTAIADWWEDAAEFSVWKEGNSEFIINPKITVKVGS